MKAGELLEEIFETKTVVDENKENHPLEFALDQREGEFLRKIISENGFKKTIEIGCANGISALYICSAYKNAGDCSHTIIDPKQSSLFKNTGISNLKRAGIDFYELIEEPSELALPALLAKGAQFDFALIDGWHTFDHTLIDFFYLNRMIRVGGVIAIDDVGFAGINKMVRYVLNYPCYELLDKVELKFSTRRRMFDTYARKPFSMISKIVPQRFRPGLFSGQVVRSDDSLGLNASMVALRKIKEDDRSYFWFKDF